MLKNIQNYQILDPIAQTLILYKNPIDLIDLKNPNPIKNPKTKRSYQRHPKTQIEIQPKTKIPITKT